MIGKLNGELFAEITRLQQIVLRFQTGCATAEDMQAALLMDEAAEIRLTRELAARHPAAAHEGIMSSGHATPDMIASLVCHAYGLSIGDIRRKNRSNSGKVQECRAALIALLNNVFTFSMSLNDIAMRFLANRDHTTLIYTVRHHLIIDDRFRHAAHEVASLLKVDAHELINDIERSRRARALPRAAGL